MSRPTHPTTRILALLELLETHDRMSGPEIARRLEVGERTVRRYMTLLEEIGVPVEAERRRYGSYRLRPGYKLPPLMFNDEEALAVVLGLLAIRQSGFGAAPADAEGALAKVERVLPDRLRARARAVREAVVLAGETSGSRPTGAIIGVLSEATHRRRRAEIRYRTPDGATRMRAVDVYGVVSLSGVWYAAGYDHLRADMRTFRIDRVLTARMLEEAFASPADFDPVAFVKRSIATAPGFMAVELLLETTLEEARELIPAEAATLEEAPRGVLVHGQVHDPRDLTRLAQILAGLRRPLVIYEPAELRDELRRLAEHTTRLAARRPQ